MGNHLSYNEKARLGNYFHKENNFTIEAKRIRGGKTKKIGPTLVSMFNYFMVYTEETGDIITRNGSSLDVDLSGVYVKF